MHPHSGDVVAVHIELQADHAGGRSAVNQTLVQDVVHCMQLPIPTQQQVP